MCKHIGTHDIQFERIAKRKKPSDYVGLFVNLSMYLNEYLWDGKRDILLLKEKLNQGEVLQFVDPSEQLLSKNDIVNSQSGEQQYKAATPIKQVPEPKLKRGRQCGPHFNIFQGRINNFSVHNRYVTPKKVRGDQDIIQFDSLDNDLVVWGIDLFKTKSKSSTDSFEIKETTNNLHMDSITPYSEIGPEDPLPFSNK
jgi:hypothetical protein